MRRVFQWMDHGSGRPSYVPSWYWRVHQAGFLLVMLGALVPYWFTAAPYGRYGRLVYIAFPLAFAGLSYGVMYALWRPAARHARPKDDHERSG